MAGYDDFLNDYLRRAAPTATPQPVPTPGPAPSYRSRLEQLLRDAESQLQGRSVDYSSPRYPFALMPSPPVSGAIPGVNPNPQITQIPIYGTTSPTVSGNPIDGDGTAGARSHRSEVGALIDDLKNRQASKARPPEPYIAGIFTRPPVVANKAMAAIARLKGK